MDPDQRGGGATVAGKGGHVQTQGAGIAALRLARGAGGAYVVPNFSGLHHKGLT
ncbi:MAG: hypothetical protein AAGG57_13695 [Pseudomonadota bacterium]